MIFLTDCPSPSAIASPGTNGPQTPHRLTDRGPGASLRILAPSLDTATASGRLMLNVIGSVAQFEREIILERQFGDFLLLIEPGGASSVKVRHVTRLPRAGRGRPRGQCRAPASARWTLATPTPSRDARKSASAKCACLIQTGPLPMNVIPFTRTPVVKDVALEDKLKAEWPTILRSSIEGCLAWQEDKTLSRPRTVESR